MLTGYPLLCHAAGCDQPAGFKIAARWTDGQTAELKTYSLCCAACVPAELAAAAAKNAACRRAAGEELGPAEVFSFGPGRVWVPANVSTPGRSPGLPPMG